jgi:hypothetical protein
MDGIKAAFLVFTGWAKAHFERSPVEFKFKAGKFNLTWIVPDFSGHLGWQASWDAHTFMLSDSEQEQLVEIFEKTMGVACGRDALLKAIDAADA